MRSTREIYKWRTVVVAIGRAFILISLLVSPAQAENTPDSDQQLFADWLAVLVDEARQRGISAQVLEDAFTGLQPDSRVLGFDRNQPEFTQSFDQYLQARVSDDRVKKGRQLYDEHREQLQRVGNHYGVDPRYLVAFWGLESSFGRYQGKYSVIRSLATLAYDPRRAAFFRNELLSALHILEEQHVPAENLVGGWAGAMGQSQFMPSSFLRYAQDFDGDGRKNIWNSKLDVWASIAFYLKENGWVTGQAWGLKVALPEGFVDQIHMLKAEQVSSSCRALKYHTRKLPVAEWQKLGITDSRGNELPFKRLKAALVIPDLSQSIDPQYTYMTLPNFRSILSYNCANKYAVSVGLMADML